MWNSVIFAEFIVILLVISTWGLSQIHFSYLESIISPASKLHITSLFIKWEPSNVNFAGGLEDARGDVGTHALVGHHNISVVCTIKGFVCTKNKDLYKLLKLLFETKIFSSFDFCVCCVVLNWILNVLLLSNLYLLYISKSGFQMCLGGILMSSMLPKSDLFHFKLTSFHSW